MKRNLSGRFINKQGFKAKQRGSLTLTPTAWQQLDVVAQRQGCSRSELIEQYAGSLETGMNQLEPKNDRLEHHLAESEERLQAIFNQAAVGINQIGLDGYFVRVNPAYCEITGYSEAELLQMTWWEITHPDDVEGERANSQRLLAGDVNGFTLEKRYFHKNGSTVWVNITSSVVRDANGQAKYTVGVIQDIGDRKQIEQERDRLLEGERTARLAAEAANRIKDEFLAVLSHELRSPLNPILGWTKLLRSRQFDPQATDHALETIERNATLQAELIEDLLDVSRILQGKLSLNVAPVDLVETIQSALETVRLAAEAKSINLSFEIATITHLENLAASPRSPLTVLGDASRLKQIVWNLLSNAVKFTPAGGHITLQLLKIKAQEPEQKDEPTSIQNLGAAGNSRTQPSTLSAQPLEKAQIIVTDSGKGISPEFLPYVFEYFRQEDSSTTRKFGGLGLGLAIVRHLTELHGGTIQAESDGEGLGATFRVTLPLLNPEGSISPQKVGSPFASNASLLADLRVLVIDDDEDMRELAAISLSQYGARVEVAASAKEALRAINRCIPDVLVSDIGMPDTDGYMLMRQVRSLSPAQGGSIPAIALTAYAGEASQQEALAAGFQLYITKPADPETLANAISSLVSESSKNKEPKFND